MIYSLTCKNVETLNAWTTEYGNYDLHKSLVKFEDWNNFLK